MNNIVLSIKHLTKNYKNLCVVNDLSLRVEKVQIFVISDKMNQDPYNYQR